MEKILAIVKMLIPKNKLGAWLLGLIGAGLALLIGANNAELKDAYCKAEPVALPKIEAPVVPVSEEK